MYHSDFEVEHHAVIERTAYHLWEQRGRPFGSPELDWVRAEREMAGHVEEVSATPVAASVAAAVGSALGSVAGLVSAITGHGQQDTSSSHHSS